MKQQFTYRPEVLVELAQEHLNAAHDLMWFMRTPHLYTEEGRIADSTKNETCRRTWSALRDACNMVGADMDVVLATVKALDRHEKRKQQQHWWTVAHLARGTYSDVLKGREAAIRCNFTKLDTYRVRADIRPRPWTV